MGVSCCIISFILICCRLGSLRCTLLSSVTSTSVRVFRRLHVAVWLCILSCGLAKNLLDGAVLITVTHPVFEVTMQLTSRNATLSAVHLALDTHLPHRILLFRVSLMSMDKGASSSPSPLHVVWSRVAAGKRNCAVKSSVNFVEVGVCEAEANAVNGIKVIEYGVMKLRRKI